MLGLSRSGNSEVRFAFLDLAVQNRFDPGGAGAGGIPDRCRAGASSSGR